MAKLSEIFDDFENGTLDTTLWNDSLNTTETGGYAAITAAGTYNNRLGSNTTRDFTQDTIQWEWTYPSASPAGAEQFFEIYTGAAGETIQMGRFQGSLGWDYNGASEFVTFNATNHRFCRIRTTATQIFFEASADGSSWSNPFTTGVATLAGWSLTSVIIKFVNAFFSGAGGGEMRIMQVGTNATVAVSGAETETGTESESIGISDTETETGVETNTISASGSDTETETGAENQTIGVTGTDTSSSTESESIAQPTSDSEVTGAGTETQSITSNLTDTEIETGAETHSLAVTISSTDTFSGADSEAFGDDTPEDSEPAAGGESEWIQIFQAPATERSLVMGPATLYIAPFGALEPANGAVGSAPDSGVWTDLGGILGGVELHIDQEWIEVELKQLPDKPMKRLKKRRLTIKTQLAEPTLANLAYALNDTAAVTGVAFEPTVRSEASILSYNALIVDGWAPNFLPGGRHKRRRVIIRKCLSIDNVQLTYKKDEQAVYTVTWTCHYVDSTTPIFRVIDQA